jgi:ATP-dependent 26S proteasome regulatory subunit
MAYFGTASCYVARVAGTIPKTLIQGAQRRGRFSEKLTIPLPNAEHRVQLLNCFLPGTRMQHELTISDVASQLDGALPADLQAVCIAANA